MYHLNLRPCRPLAFANEVFQVVLARVRQELPIHAWFEAGMNINMAGVLVATACASSSGVRNGVLPAKRCPPRPGNGLRPSPSGGCLGDKPGDPFPFHYLVPEVHAAVPDSQ